MGLEKLIDAVFSTVQYIYGFGWMLEFSSQMRRKKGRAIERRGSKCKQSDQQHM